MKRFFCLNLKQYISLVLSFTLLLLPIEVYALPLGQNVVAGSATFEKMQNSLKITTSNKAIINYNSFNIGRNELVKFIQPSANSVVLNRVVLANPSSILGSLNANGKVFLVNPAGIYFGPNSSVNANSFLATTLNIADDDFLKGNYKFSQIQDRSGYIIQKGTISVSPLGFVVLASPFISSEGVILAKGGSIVLGATDNFYIQFDANGLIKYDYTKPLSNDDKPIAIQKEQADTIINNIINTDELDKAIKIVKHGDKIELVGAKGTALVSSSLDVSKGDIKVNAQSKTFILGGAKLKANAKDDAGNIDIYAHDLTYSAGDVQYEAKSEEGNGGFIEVSAKKKVVFDGSKIDLSSKNGKNGTFLIDPEDLVVDSDMLTNGADLYLQADSSIEVNNGAVISTRNIAGSNHLDGLSVGNSGDLTLDAKSIEIKDGSKLLSFANEGFDSGDIILKAISNTSDVGFEADAKILLSDAFLKGGLISIKATASSQDHFDSTDENHPVDAKNQVLDFFSDSPISPVGLSIAQSKANIEIGSGASIEGSSIDIKSSANSQGSVMTIFTAVGIGYGKSVANAQTTIKSGALLKSSGNIDIKTEANSDNKVRVYTAGLGAGRGSKANLTLAYTKSELTSKATVENGATIQSSGDLNVKAYSDKSILSLASAGSYDDGTLGVAVAISDSSSQTEATLGGDISAKNLSVGAYTDNNLVKTVSTAAAGSGFVGKRVLSATNNLISKAEQFLKANGPASNPASGANKIGLSAALSYANHSTDTLSHISDNAVVNVQNDTDIIAQNEYPIDLEDGSRGVKTSSVATVDSSIADKKEFSVAGAISITKLTNNTQAFVGEEAVLNSGNDIDIEAKMYMPYEVTWGQIHSVSDLSDHANSNLGIQNGFFTTWAQSNSEGDVVGAAGSVNYFHMNNDTEAIIEKNAKIKQGKESVGTVRLSATTDIQTMNLAGVLGWKVLGASGKSGVGGSYLDIKYDDKTIAEIKDGAYVKAKGLSLDANSETKNASIAEAGGMADKFGVAGSVSFIEINNKTYTNISNAQIELGYHPAWADNFTLSANDYSKILNISGGLIKSQNVGIGVSVSKNEITRDTHSWLDGVNFTNEGTTLINAKNSGEIGSYSLAATVNVPFGTSVEGTAANGAGKYGIGISGDVALNDIKDSAKSEIINSNYMQNSDNPLKIKAVNDSKIKSLSGSVALSLNANSAGLAGSYSHNKLNNTALALVENSSLLGSHLELLAINKGYIDALSASGSGAGMAGVAGSVSLNEIYNDTYAKITDNSDVKYSEYIDIKSDSTAGIKTISGAASFGGKAGIGSSFAKNQIEKETFSYVENSNIKADQKIDISSVDESNMDIVSASLGASLSGMAAAIAVAINNIENSIKAYITNDTGTNKSVIAKDDVRVLAEDTSTIYSRGGEIGASGQAGFGATVLYNDISNTVKAFVKNLNLLQTDKNIKIQASSQKSIESYAASGVGAGSVATAGGVLINKMQDYIDTYVENSTLNTSGSISLQAIEDNDMQVKGGTLAGAGTVGIGGTVSINSIDNKLNAYILDSDIKAGGNADAISVYKADESMDKTDIRGLDVLAFSNEKIKSEVVNLSGGGTASIGASVGINSVDDSLNSYIENSRINENASGENSLQDVSVRATSIDDITILAGGLNIGGTAGVGASFGRSMIYNKTNAYIEDSVVYAKNRVGIDSNSFNRLNSVVVSGAFSGAASVGGSVAIMEVDSQTESYSKNSEIYSIKDIDILADSMTYLGEKKNGDRQGILAGSLNIGGGAGVGGSVVVTKVNQDVKAHSDDSKLNAKGKTTISSDSLADVLTYAVSGNLGAYGGVGGAVTINTISSSSKAYTLASGSNKMLINQDESYKTNAQNVEIKAHSYNSINSTPGAISGGFVGASGSIDVATIHSTVLADVGANTRLNSGRDLLVKASSNKRIYSNVAAGSGGAIGIAGAVSVANINTNIDSDSLDASDDTQSFTNDMISRSSVDDQLGDSNLATDTKNSLDVKTANSNLDEEFDASSSPAETTIARIDNGSHITVGHQTKVVAVDDSSIETITGTAGAGILGAGGSVGIGHIGIDSRAYIGSNVQLTSGSLILNSEIATDGTKIESYTAAAGAVGLGAAFSKLNIEYENDAYVNGNAQILTNGDIELESTSTLKSSSIAKGASAGAGAVGIVKASLHQKGDTKAYIGANSNVNAGGRVDVVAKYLTDIDTLSEAAAAGIVSGSGSMSEIKAEPTVLAKIYNNVVLDSDDETNIYAKADGNVKSKANGVNAGGVNVGVSSAKSSWLSDIKSKIGDDTLLHVGNLKVRAYENMSDSGNSLTDNMIKAEAFSAVGSLVGGSGSTSRAKSQSSVGVVVGKRVDITSNNRADIYAKSYTKDNAESYGKNYGVLTAGTTKAYATNKKTVSITLSNDADIKSQNKMDIQSYGRVSAYAKSEGGAGGLLASGGTGSYVDVSNDVSVRVEDRVSLYSDNSDIDLKAKGYIYASSRSTIETDGGITKNESEANVDAPFDIRVDIGKDVSIEANSVNILAQSTYLKLKAYASSKTFAADSSSKAYTSLESNGDISVDIDNRTNIVGRNSINVEALQGYTETSSHARGKIEAGITGTIKTIANNDVDFTSKIDIKSDATLSSKEINIKSIAPSKTEDSYYKYAESENNSVVYWVLEEVEKLVKKVSWVPLLGEIVEWVTETVTEYVRHVVGADTTSEEKGNFYATGTIIMNGNLKQQSSSPQRLVISKDGVISRQGDINAHFVGSKIVVDNLKNEDVGKINIESSSDLYGSGTIYFNSAYPDVKIENYTDKSLVTQLIDVYSNNANEPNVKIDTRRDSSNFAYKEDTTEHFVNIENFGTGDIFIKGNIKNYSGTTNIYNKYGSILGDNNHHGIETNKLNLKASNAKIGDANRIFAYMYNVNGKEAKVSTDSLLSTYMVIELYKKFNSEPHGTIDGINLDEMYAVGKLDLVLNTAKAIWVRHSIKFVKPIEANYDINKIVSKRSGVSIYGLTGVNTVVNGMIKSGEHDVDVDLGSSLYVQNDTQDDIYLKNISTPLTSYIDIDLLDGSLGGNGLLSVVDGYQHVSIENGSDKNIHIGKVDLDRRISGSFSHEAGSFSNKEINGYSSAKIDIKSTANGSVKLQDKLFAPIGEILITSNNGIYNPTDSLIDAKNIKFNLTGGELGSKDNFIRVNGIVSADSTNNVYLQSDNDLVINHINAQNSLVSLNSEGKITSENLNANVIEASDLKLEAKGDIVGKDGDSFKTSVDKLALTSLGRVDIKNDKSLRVDLVDNLNSIKAKESLHVESLGDFLQAENAKIESSHDSVSIKAKDTLALSSITAKDKISLEAKKIEFNNNVATNIKSENFILKANKFINDINTYVDNVDVEDRGLGGFTLKNQKSLHVKDLDADGYALSSQGDIKLKMDSEDLYLQNTSKAKNIKIYANRIEGDASLSVEADKVVLETTKDIKNVKTKTQELVAVSKESSINIENEKDTLYASLKAKDEITLQTSGELIQKGEISSDSSIELKSDLDMKIDYVKATDRISLTSKEGSITQDGDSEVDLEAKEILLKAKNGIGDDGVNEDYLDTKVSVIDIKNTTSNNIAIRNSGLLYANDLDGDGYALYNGAGDIKIETDVSFTNVSGKRIYATKAVNIKALNNIFVSNIGAKNILLTSVNGDILGDRAYIPNVSANVKLSLVAKNGVAGSTTNPIYLGKNSGSIKIDAKTSNLTGDFIPTNIDIDTDWFIFSNRLIAGNKMDEYNSVISNSQGRVKNSTFGHIVSQNFVSANNENLIEIEEEEE